MKTAAIGSVVHVIDSRRAPGRCFAAMVVAVVAPGGFEAQVFWPDGHVIGGSPRYFHGRDEDEGTEWHWPDSEVWHSAL